jgi:hypothetical protein
MPFKSDKQRKWMFANEPEMAREWAVKEQRKAIGGLVKNEFAREGSLQDFAKMRSGGLIGNGSLTPGKVKTFKAQCKNKFKDS